MPLDIRNHGGGYNDAGYVYTPSQEKLIMWRNFGNNANDGVVGRSSSSHYNFIGAFIANKLVVSDMIISTSGVIQGSDARIKKNIEDVSDDVCLKKLRELRPKTYNYIDTTQRTTSEVYGFIAQEVREVFPEAIQIGTNTIPNIMVHHRITQHGRRLRGVNVPGAREEVRRAQGPDQQDTEQNSD